MPRVDPSSFPIRITSARRLSQFSDSQISPLSKALPQSYASASVILKVLFRSFPLDHNHPKALFMIRPLRSMVICKCCEGLSLPKNLLVF